MDMFLKATGTVLIAVILCLVLSKHGKDYAVLLSVAAGTLVLLAASVYLEPVVSFFSRLVQLGQLDSNVFFLLIKISGIALITQIACVICSDAGNKSLEKVLQILSSFTILWITIPLLDEMLQMMESLLEVI